MHLAANLRRTMEERGLNQEALARLAGVSQPTISRVLAGTHHTSAAKVERIAYALGVPVAELLGPPAQLLEGITETGRVMLVGWLLSVASREPTVAKALREFAANDFIRQCGAFE